MTEKYACEPLVQKIKELSEELESYKKKEKAFQEVEERFRIAFNNAPIGIVLTDSRSVVLDCNKHFADTFGARRENYLGINLLARMPQGAVRQTLVETIADGNKHGYEGPYVSIITGKKMDLSISTEKAAGDLFVTIITDITDRKRTEEALRESEDIFRVTFKSSPDAVNINRLDDGLYVDINEGFTRITGYTRADVLGNTSLTLDIWHDPADRQQLVQGLREKGYVENLEAQFRKKDGSLIAGLMSARVISLKGVPHILSISRDITERRNAQNALMESEERYRTILESIEEGYYEVTLTGTLTFCNDSLCRIWGYPKEKLLGMDYRQYTDAQHAKKLFRTFKEVFRTGKPAKEFDWQIISNDGSKKDIEASVALLKNISDMPTGFNGIVRDITERKRAEEAISHSNKLLQTIINTAPMRIFFKNKELRYMGCNNAFARDAGVERPEDLIGKDDYQLAWKEQAGLYQTDDLGVIESGVPKLSYEEPQTTPEGNQMWLRTSKVPLRNEANQIIGVLGMYEDITEHKKVEEALRESQAFKISLLETIPIPVSFKDNSGRFQVCNRAFQNFFAKTKDQLIGKSVFDLNPPELARSIHAKDSELFEKQGSQVYETRILDGHGALHDVVMHKVSLTDSFGAIIGLIGVILDITERKKSEEEREKLQNQLVQAQKMESIGQLAGGVAHDFNNMLGVILGHAEMAMDQVDHAQPLYSDLEEIRKAAQRSADITRQLLAFARKQTIAPKVLDLNQVVEKLLKMLRRLIGEAIDLIWMPGAGLWPIKADPSQIDQILTNLCVNARDAIAGVGKITVETGKSTFDNEYCSAHPGFLSGDYVRISIHDTGCGMDKLTLVHIFEPFFTTKGVGEGTGLGLAMVYGAVKQNKGFINVVSEPGQGTIFTIYLPRYMDADGTGMMWGESGAQPALGGLETILLVEDEPAILKMTVLMLQRLGYRVLAAGNPSEAMRLVKEFANEIHLLITDVIMPEMNGRDLAQQLLGSQKKMKCLFMSGYTADIIANQGALDEGVQFIQKPFPQRELALKIRDVLEGEV